MGEIDELWRYDGRRVVVTGCASGIGADVARQLVALGAEVIGLDIRPPEQSIGEFISLDLSDPASIDAAAASIGGRVDSLFNIAGVSSGIGDPLRVVTINFLGTRRFTEALVPVMPPGSAIANVSSLAASAYRENARRHCGSGGLRLDGRRNRVVRSESGSTGGRRRVPAVQGGDHPVRNGDGVDVGRQGASGSTAPAPGVTDTPILDQLRSAYGEQFLDSFPTPLGRTAGPGEQATCWCS